MNKAVPYYRVSTERQGNSAADAERMRVLNFKISKK